MNDEPEIPTFDEVPGEDDATGVVPDDTGDVDVPPDDDDEEDDE